MRPSIVWMFNQNDVAHFLHLSPESDGSKFLKLLAKCLTCLLKKLVTGKKESQTGYERVKSLKSTITKQKLEVSGGIWVRNSLHF